MYLTADKEQISGLVSAIYYGADQEMSLYRHAWVRNSCFDLPTQTTELPAAWLAEPGVNDRRGLPERIQEQVATHAGVKIKVNVLYSSTALFWAATAGVPRYKPDQHDIVGRRAVQRLAERAANKHKRCKHSPTDRRSTHADTIPDTVIIDAGSSSSRVYVYKWGANGDNDGLRKLEILRTVAGEELAGVGCARLECSPCWRKRGTQFQRQTLPCFGIDRHARYRKNSSLRH